MQIKKISTIKEVISKETSEDLQAMVDDMCGLVSNLNSHNYDMFIKTRESYINRLRNLTIYRDRYHEE